MRAPPTSLSCRRCCMGRSGRFFGDQAYWKEADRQTFAARGVCYRVNRRPSQRPLTQRWRLINQARSRTRACGEHAFRWSSSCGVLPRSDTAVWLRIWPGRRPCLRSPICTNSGASCSRQEQGVSGEVSREPQLPFPGRTHPSTRRPPTLTPDRVLFDVKLSLYHDLCRASLAATAGQSAGQSPRTLVLPCAMECGHNSLEIKDLIGLASRRFATHNPEVEGSNPSPATPHILTRREKVP